MNELWQIDYNETIGFGTMQHIFNIAKKFKQFCSDFLALHKFHSD